MLVLTRKPQETVIIDGQITVKILQVQPNRIRLGIDAPASVGIRRGELGPLTQRDDVSLSTSATDRSHTLVIETSPDHFHD